MKVLCCFCEKYISKTNFSRHKRNLHSFCSKCSIFGNLKKHRCFLEADDRAEDAYVQIMVPVLISKKCLNKLNQLNFLMEGEEAGSAVTPDLGIAYEYIVGKTMLGCFACFFSADGKFEHNCKDRTAGQLLDEYFDQMCCELSWCFDTEFSRTLFKACLEEQLSNSSFSFV